MRRSRHRKRCFRIVIEVTDVLMVSVCTLSQRSRGAVVSERFDGRPDPADFRKWLTRPKLFGRINLSPETEINENKGARSYILHYKIKSVIPRVRLKSTIVLRVLYYSPIRRHDRSCYSRTVCFLSRRRQNYDYVRVPPSSPYGSRFTYRALATRGDILIDCPPLPKIFGGRKRPTT